MYDSTPIAVSVNFDSLNEAFGFPQDFTDPSFFAGFDRLAEALTRSGLKATIFVIGRDLENPQIRTRVRAWHEAGFEIGNHSYNHHMNLGALPTEDLKSEVRRGHDLIGETVGTAPRGFIAPAWAASRRLISYLVDLGYDYDSSLFPSATIMPIATRIALNHRHDPERRHRALARRDWFHWITKPRHPFVTDARYKVVRDKKPVRGQSLVMLPMPTTGRLAIPHWHTKGFLLGWDRHYRELARLLREQPFMYYLIHPADFVSVNDLDDHARCHSLERMDIPITEKMARLEEAFRIMARSGRPRQNMAGLVKSYHSRFASSTASIDAKCTS